MSETFAPHESGSEAATLVALLRQTAGSVPDDPAYVFLQDGNEQIAAITYSELDAKARVIAARLVALDAAGERALLLFHPGLEFLAAFFGCLYAGVIAVPAYPPRLKRRAPRIAGIVHDTQARFALSTADILGNIERRFEQMPELAAMTWLDTGRILTEAAGDFLPGALDPDTIAFLQYTSGSTNNPKGVMVSHRNLMHNLAVICHGFQIRQLVETHPPIYGLSWLPVYHDMGLIGGILQPLYVNRPTFVMSPASFLQRPVRWLEAISKFRGSISGAPNFAYQLCVDKISPEQCAGLDLSSWKVAYSGAEPVKPATLRQFAEKFAPYGFSESSFYPCYGLAEATLIASGSVGASRPTTFTVDKQALKSDRVVPVENAEAEEAGVIALTGCGSSLLDQQILIVNPDTMLACAPDEVGEIWLAGDSVAEGYWQKPELSESTFRAFTADNGAGPFLRTGDLGFVHDGQLYVTGRRKDLIIIRGRNHYPQDIEHTVQLAHPALEPDMGAAFSVEIDGEERLVITQELSREQRRADVAEVAAEVRRAVAEEHDLRLHALILLKPYSIPRTSSGKIKRYACKEMYLDGTLEVIGEWREYVDAAQSERRAGAPEAETIPPGEAAMQLLAGLQEWLTEQLAGLLRVSPREIDPERPFTYYGLDSAQAVGVAGELEQHLGVDLPPTLLYDQPTIRALTEHLTQAFGPQPDSRSSGAEFEAADEPAPTEREAVAIIGMGCRFPGADDPDSFWQLLVNGVDAISEVPPERYDVDGYFSPEPATPGKMNTRWGGFLRNIADFDPHFFGISPREAARIDPQQRLLLEVAWEALENAGWAPAQLAGTATGVFVGISSNEYSRLQFHDPLEVDAYAGTGNAFSIAANRISYLFDLRGPSLAIDTACSSSLVAVHQAVQSLRNGESDLALAGGVSIMLFPDVTIFFSQARVMSSDGRCKTFDAAADGYVRSEGCGMVVLKRLSDAVRDGDNVLAVIQGSAVNQDGRSNGLTAPNSRAQQAVIRRALQNAGIAPAEVQYVEAHGTGTSLGDPIEVRSLRAVLEAERTPDDVYYVGSVKTNIGHAEAAAGVAGLIKSVLALQHDTIPPHLHFRTLNPYIDLAGSTLRIPTGAQPWPRTSRPRVAGVSSFGFGGTNAHIVLSDPPLVSASAPAEAALTAGEVQPFDPPARHLLTLSAHSPAALATTIARYQEFLASGHHEASLADIAYTTNTGRNHQLYRLAVVADSKAALADSLAAAARAAGGRRPAVNKPVIAFLFGGTGNQYAGMGRELYESSAVYRAAIDRADAALRDELELPLRSVLYPELFPLGGAEQRAEGLMAYSQPALMAVEYALCELWRSWGITPDLVLGHSTGEYAAALAAGAFDLEDGLKLLARRGRLMDETMQQGRMAAVFAPRREVEEFMRTHAAGGLSEAVAISAVNTPRNVVVSGEEWAVTTLLTEMKAAGIDSQALDVSRAAHSPLVAPMLSPYAQMAAEFSFQSLELPLASTVDGALLPAGDALDVGYWERHLSLPVLFMDGIGALAEAGVTAFIEIAPQPSLLAMGRRCLPDLEALWLPSLRKRRPDRQVMLESLGSLYEHGGDPHWPGLVEGATPRKAALPTSVFERERYWFEPAAGKAQAGASPPHARETLSRQPSRLPTALPIYEWQPGGGSAGDACRTLASFAARDLFGPGVHEIGSWLQSEIGLGERTVLQAYLTVQDARNSAIQIFAGQEGASGWELVASGQLRARPAAGLPEIGLMRNGDHKKHAPLIPTPTLLQSDRAATSPAHAVEQTVAERLQQATSEDARRALLTEYLREVLAQVLGMPPERLLPEQPLDTLGMDSLMAIELKSRLEREQGISLPVVRFLEGPSLVQLADSLLESSEHDDAATMITAGDRPPAGPHPLSVNQQALWFLHELLPAGMSFNVAGATRISGAMNLPALRRAFAGLFQRHAALRLTFRSEQGSPVQRVREDAPLPFLLVDARDWSAAALQDYLVMEAYQPFDLENGPIMRLVVLERADEEHVLLLAMDHIIVDLWSLSVLVQELYLAYRAEADEQAIEPEALPITYSDYVYWEQEFLGSPAAGEMRAYWLEQLAGELPALNLPTDRPRPAVQTFAGELANLLLPSELAAGLRGVGREHGATLYMTLLAAFQTLLHRYSGQDDLVVGTVLAGRNRPELAGLMGYFINPLAMRADFSGAPSFASFLRETRRRVLGAVANQDYPLPLLVDQLDFPRDPSRPPIFETMFIMQQAQILDGQQLSAFSPGMPDAVMSLDDLTLQSLPLPGMPAQFDLTLMVGEMPDGLGVSLHYNCDLFDDATIERMLVHFRLLLEGIVADPQRPVTAIPLLPTNEREQVLVTWNESAMPLPDGERLHDLIARQAARQPDATAIVAPDRTLSYGQLEQEATRLADYLTGQGVGPGALVGISAARRSYLPVGLLATLKAGAAYVPLDPSFPVERLAQMWQEARPVVLLTDNASGSLFEQAESATVILLDEPLPQPSLLQALLGQANGSRHEATPEDLAYVIYTSGSTGIPKGVQISHRAIVNFLRSMQRAPGMGPEDNLLAVTTVSFDIAALELFLPLAVGAQVTMAGEEETVDGVQLAALLNESRATVMQATPAGWQMLFEAGWRGSPALRKILCGGEALPQNLAARLLETGAELWNMYGPTETTVWSTTTRITDAGDVTIGRPIGNTFIYLLDGGQQPVPIGVPGDLCIGGAGVAAGYFNRPELTAERFVPDPFSGVPGATMYRTGDKARYRPDGRLVFLGRDDHQVKIRGFRIELGDIEAALAQHPAGEPNVVIVREDRPGDKRLTAYLVRRKGQDDPQPEALREFLREKLPEYMVPAVFVVLDRLPLTPNGKVDRRALPPPTTERPTLFDQYAAPRTDEEAQLAALLADVLNLDRVGLHDNFFDLGGNSLLATRLIFRVSELAGVHIPLRYLFAEPTVAGLARAIAEARQPRTGESGRESIFGEVSAETLLADVVLPAEIQAGSLPSAAITEPDAVFLTGVTGFVGAFLLRDLLERTDAIVYCLVRAADAQAGWERVFANMERYGLWEDGYEPRIAIVPGDLAKPRFGLSPEQFDELAHVIDIIYHNGAMVNFVYPYQTHRGSNVYGTVEALRLASSRRLKAVHFVSTLSVLHTGAHNDGTVYPEDVDLTANGAPFGGYAQSKWVAEQIVLEAGRRGVPVAVYRPGPISGDSESGVMNSQDLMSGLARACLLLGAAPELDVMADLAPVEYVSGAIVVLSLRRDSFGKTFHLANPNRWAYGDLLEWIRSRGFSLHTVPYEQWRDQLLTLARQFGGDEWGAFLPLLEETESGQIYMPAFDHANTLAGLAGSDIECPPVGPELLQRYLDYFLHSGFIPAPAPAATGD